ncbi:hypothetical protein [Thioalkalivibrio sp.]|uniref:hypothetical protein n=1 Tax=Thioalkalivibrio sp. TaxID=2093813 RepID=UPI00356B4FAE
MNLEEIADKKAHVRMDNFEASDLLTSLKRHADDLGDLGQELIAALEAQGVEVIEEEDNPRDEYVPPRDLHRV